MKKVFVVFCRFVVAWLLLFVSVALVMAMLGMPVEIDRQNAVVPLLFGFVGGLLFFSFITQFTPVYVLGHELTHWLAAKCFLRRTGSLKLGMSQGSVAVERPNVWIVLAPYFVPLYALVWIGLYGVVCFWCPEPGLALTRTFYAGLGLSYAFHTVLTLYALSREQEDLRFYGRFFSLALVLLSNLLLLFLALIMANRAWGRGGRLLLYSLGKEWRTLLQLAEMLRNALGR